MSQKHALVPVRIAMKIAAREGVNPLDNHAAVMAAWIRYAKMCGAVPSVPALLQRQAG
jgi:hypothetical protein